MPPDAPLQFTAVKNPLVVVGSIACEAKRGLLGRVLFIPPVAFGAGLCEMCCSGNVVVQYNVRHPRL